MAFVCSHFFLFLNASTNRVLPSDQELAPTESHSLTRGRTLVKAQTLLLKKDELSKPLRFSIYLTCDATRPFPGEELTRGTLNFNRLTSWTVAMVEEVETRAGGKAINPWQAWGTLTLRGGRLHVKCQEERQKPETLNKIVQV